MLADYQTLVMDLARDDGGKVSTTQRDAAITAMVERYSSDRPKQSVVDVTPDSAQVLPLPTGWVEEFSKLESLEYPIGQVPPSLIPADRVSLYRSPTGLKFQLRDAVAVAATNVRATFSIKHTVSGAADTIPTHHREPAACWAAAMLCDELAAFYSSGTDSSIQADSVEQRSKAQEYSARAKVLRKRYLDELGIDDKRGQSAGAFVVHEQGDSFGGSRLLHPALRN